MSFNGFSRETFDFLIEISFNNNIEWFNANRSRYERFVRDPMRELCAELMPTALEIDPNFNPSVNSSVSRIRRDTRFSRDKSPFRNHMWIAFRYPNTSISEGCALYFEITPGTHAYGMGFYATAPAFMAEYRKRVLADPAGFLALAKQTEEIGFHFSSESYKRDRFPDAPAELKRYINIKSFVWNRELQEIDSLIAPSDIAEKLKADFLAGKPMYDFMRSILQSVFSESFR